MFAHKWSGVPVFLLIVALGLCLQPWWLPFDLGGYDYARWVETAFLSVLPLAALLFTWRLALSSFSGYFIYLTIFLLLSVLVCAFSELGWLSSVEGTRAFLWMAVLVLLTHAYSEVSPRGRQLVAAFLIGLLFVQVLYTLLGLSVLLVDRVSGIQYLVSGFATYNFAGGFYALCFLLMPGLHENARPNRFFSRGVCYLVGIGLFFLIFMIRSRGSLLGVLVALSLLAFIGHGEGVRRYWRRILCYAAGGLILFVLVQVIETALGGVKPVSAARLLSASGRFALWDVAWNGFLASPLLGHGPLSYSLNIRLYNAHPHNLVLSLLYEYGGIFVVFVFMMVGLMAAKLWRYRAPLGADVSSLAGLAVVMAFSVHIQFSGLSMVPATVMIFAVGLMLCFSPVVTEESSSFSRFRLIGARVFTVPVIIAVLIYPCLVWGYWHTFPGRRVAEPRFWLDGEIVSPPPWPFQFKTR